MKYTALYFIPLFFWSCTAGEKEVTPQLKKLTEAVYASGTLITENEYSVKASIDGFLEMVNVKEGDPVKKGMLLFSISNSNATAGVEAAQKLLTKTAPVVSPDAPLLNELQDRMATARIRLMHDSLLYIRYSNLFSENAISKSQYEKYLVQYQASSNELGALQEQIRMAKLNAGIQYQQAANQVHMAKTQQHNGVLKSFSDGIIYEIYAREGDLILPNQPIALIGSGRMIAKLSVDEDDLGKLYAGQKIQLTMDAYPDSIFTAVVGRIYPKLNKVEQSFRVDAWFDKPLQVSMYGLNVEANILVRENVSVQVIPSKAFRNGDSILVKQNGRMTMMKVTRGVESDNWVEIPEGTLSANSIIVLQ